MEVYTFREGSLPAGFERDYEPAIFNWPAFAAFHQAGEAIAFYLLDERRKKMVAEIHFRITDRLARSPFRAPFGSVECSADIQPEVLYRFIEDFELRLKNKGVTDIYIKNPPRAYAPAKLSLLETFLLNQKYTATDAEVDAVIDVTEAPFAEKMRHSERLRMRQAERAGFSFAELAADQFRDVFEFISKCHQEKGYKLSIAPGEMDRMNHKFPGRYLFFVIRLGEKTVAAAVSVRVTGNILYNFLVNHEQEFNHLSPAVLLMEGIYGYCQRHNIGLFDLGTSAWQGKPNFSLLDFKRHVGAVASSRLSFYKKIA